jgi:hypothetical protein
MRKVLHYTWIATVIAALYVAWVFYSRHDREKAAEAAVAKHKQEQAQRENKAIFGSGEVKITGLSADTGVLRRGETTQLCYGVINAVRVEIDPPIEQAKPSYYHCIQIAPKTTTTYTLKVSDAKGHTKSASLTVQVK